MREYNGEYLHIDGRNIWYRLVTAFDYLEAKGYFNNYESKGCPNKDEMYCDWREEHNEIYSRLTQIMGLKQSCFLLRRVSYSCGSLSDELYDLKNELINELEEKYNFIFDDDFVEKYGHEEE